MKFSDIPGNEEVKRQLLSYARSGKVPHALLISGPSGVGKMLLARTFAQYLHCESPRDGEPCGECRSCRLHADLSHPDLHFVFPIVKAKDKYEVSADRSEAWARMLRENPTMPVEKWLEIIEAGNSQPAIYVREAEEIIRADAYAPYMGKRKIFLIWLPERLRAEAANSLLKVIEEPSDSTMFLMVSNNELHILPTIFSRVQRLHAGVVEENEIARYLRGKYGIDEHASCRMARMAGGSLTRADELGGRSGENEEFLDYYIDLMRAAYGVKISALKRLSEKIAGFGREKSRRFLAYMSAQTRENFIYNLRMPQLNMQTEPEERFSSRFSPFVNYGNVEEIIAEIDSASADIERNCNGKIVFFDMFLRIIAPLRRKPSN